jgi:queuine tRNA-ribosyltransferase subunit QTRTD1
MKEPTEVSKSGHNEREAVPIFTKRGKYLLSPKTFMKIVQAFQPNLYHMLCDGDTSQESGEKRTFKSVEKTDNFFKECLQIHKQSDKLKMSKIIASVEGGYNKKARELSIKYLNEYQAEIAGFLIDGLHTNGPDVIDMPEEPAIEIVNFVNSFLPAEKPRFTLGPYSPKMILELVKSGVDVFDSSYALVKTSQNEAITFKFDINDTENLRNKPEIDLADPIYKDEFEPFVKGCACIACKKHTRAYVHHLVNTKEMLAPILLMIHNLHHYIEFFKVIREHVKNDTIDKLIYHVSFQSAK